MAASVLDAWLARLGPAKKWPRIIVPGIVAGLVGFTLAFQVIYLAITRPIPVVLGRESKDSFLERRIGNYQAVRYIRSSLKPTDRVFMAWDGRSYYCDDRCLADAEQSQWTQLVLGEATSDGIAARLRQQGVTHLLLDLDGMGFLLEHDPTGSHTIAANVFFQSFEPDCLTELRNDVQVVLYALSCG